MKKKKLLICFFISGILIAFVLCMEIAYNIKHRGITINPKYVFNNISLFFACLILGVSPGIYFLLTNVINNEIKTDNYSSMTTKVDYKEKLSVLYFNKNAEITNLSKITKNNQYKTNVNDILKKVHINFYELKLQNDKIRCGLLFMSEKNHVYVDSSDSHNLIVGTSGSGKSFSFMMPMLCLMAMTGESGLCVDIKGELSEATAELFESKGYDVYFLDFLNPDNSNCWNPLYLGAKEYMKQLEIEKKEKKKFEKEMHSVKKEYEILHGNVAGIDLESFFGKDEAGDYIYNKESDTFKTSANFSLAQEYFKDAVQAMTTNGKKKENEQDFWNEEAARVLEGYVHLLAETGRIDIINFPSIRQLITDGDEIKRRTTRSEITFLQYYLKNYKSNTDLSKEKLSSYVDSAEQTRKSTRNVLTKHLDSILTNEDARKILSNNDIDLERIGRRKTIIYLKVHDEKQTYYPLVTLFIKQLWQCLVKQARNSPGLRLSIPFNIMFDEMGQFPSFDEITNVLTAGRSRGVRLTAVVQGFDQLDNAYGKNTAKTIKNNVMNTVYLLSGDYDTLEELSKRCGSKVTYKNGRKETERVITTDRLQNFKVGEALILRQREGPFITKMLPFNKYIFYNNLKKYELRLIPKKEPKYFNLKKEIEEREKENGE